MAILLVTGKLHRMAQCCFREGATFGVMALQILDDPALLVWARQRAGLSRKEAVRKFNCMADREVAGSAPKYPQLKQLLDAPKVSSAAFLSDPPDVPSIIETFRTLQTAELERVPSRVAVSFQIGYPAVPSLIPCRAV